MLLGFAAAAVLGFAVLAPVAAAAPGYTVRPLTFAVTVGPGNDIHCTVDADLYTPNGASAAHPVPAILATNGFGGSKADFTGIAPAYAQRGFAFLAYSGLGFGGSGCKIELDNPLYDGKAGSQLVSFLGGSKAATDGTRIDYIVHDAVAHNGVHYADDPRVGMIGGSYGGEIQFAVAEQDPRMDTIIPQITWNNLAYSLVPNNTSLGATGVTYSTPGVDKLDWPVLFFGVGVGDGIQEAAAGNTSHVGQCPNFDDAACTALVQAASEGYPDPTTTSFLWHASVASYMSNIRIPTFLTQGETDTLFDLQEAVANYQALRAQGTPVQMLWRSNGHSGGSLGTSEENNADPEAAYETRLDLQWLQYYLQGAGARPSMNFMFYEPWVPYTGDAAPAVGDVSSYPVGSERTLYLSGTSALTPTAGSIATGAATMTATPAPSSTGGGVVSTPAADAPGTAVTYSTTPLSSDTDVVGIPRVTVHLSAPTFQAGAAAGPAGELELFAKLEDYDPSTGAVTLPKNLVSAARVADVTQPVTIQLPGISYQLARGHELRLVLSTSDATFHADNGAGPVTIDTSQGEPSILTVPELDGRVPSLAAVEAAHPDTLSSTPSSSSAMAGHGVLGTTVACASRRHFDVHLRPPRGTRFVSARLYVNGRLRDRLRGRSLTGGVDLRGLPKGTVHVKLVARTSRGRTLTSRRTYHTCTPGVHHKARRAKPKHKTTR